MKRFTLPLLAASALAISACAETNDEVVVDDTADTMANETVTDAGTLVEVAQGDENFSTLVSAVTAAGLGETLSGEGPYTIFAPTNAAFDKLPAGTLDTLTMDENKEQLSGILTYHVVSGETMAEALTTAITDAGDAGYDITTVNGGTLNAKLVDGNVVLTDAMGGTATVTATDVDASNGVIHVIDTVLMPS
ncbi:uncharacterized protein HME9302_01901 [Alteripontixanthobacter maritimus]|uniref:FAS1 domain-containing protein n=1 Tax=Alteripontixanthobacter maritimus TaxID=2161824 RepID=A0A369QBS2_9SPHN|nr:fasciclin domain-containing protein [Alteripontixanthobacter maritimus]RDC60686.1 uncharacterized protein HME9302_01901 [Alteripontixanthobacter maritimus]